MAHRYTVVKITKSQLRKMFSEGDYLARAQRGELWETILRNGHPSPPKANEPFCTRSQIIAYLNRQGKKVAIAHRYLRPDGTIGLSGLPDPKTILQGETLFTI